MRVFDTEMPGVKIIEPNIFEDKRGHFFEAYNAQKFEEALGFAPKFCQINESFSRKGAIRGLHLQKEPYAQAKLVRVISGNVFDVVVDCRLDSSSFGKCVAIELSAGSYKQIWIPKGFAHGFQVLSEHCVFSYQVDNPYNPSSEVVIDAFDPELKIQWPLKNEAKRSAKDCEGMYFDELIATSMHSMPTKAVSRSYYDLLNKTCRI